MSALIKEVKALQNAQKPKKALSSIIFRTEEAPWGYKLDGTPRKQSGRPAHRKLEVAS
jgi:hypothetical protein